MNCIAAADPHRRKLIPIKETTMDISALQKIVKERYFKTDSERGVYHTALWFHEEVGELSSAIASGDKENAKEEFADVLMWLLTLANLMDVVGQNYRENELVAAHTKNPNRKIIGTENRHEQGAWLPLRDKPFMSGQFLWTGIDYLGESDWPEVAHGSGLLDKTGTARAIAYQRQSWWSDQPMLYVMRKEGNAGAGEWVSDWSPTDIDTYDEAKIQVFSNCDEVELFLNDVALSSLDRPSDDATPRIWNIAFHKGTLRAVAKNNGIIVAEQELTTAGSPAKIVLSVDRSTIANNWDDVVYVTATVTDETGLPCLNATDKIRFKADGAGVIAAVPCADVTRGDDEAVIAHVIINEGKRYRYIQFTWEVAFSNNGE